MNEQGLAAGERASAGPAASERVRSIVEAAERDADAIRRSAEEDARRHRLEAEAAALHYLEQARRRSEALVLERVRRISELSDEIVARSETLAQDLDETGELRQRLDDLVRALGATANRVAREGSKARAERLEPASDRDEEPERAPATHPSDPPGTSVPSPGDARELQQDRPPRRRRFRSGQRSGGPAPDLLGPLRRRGRQKLPPGVHADGGGGQFTGARLMALRLALAGRTREQVEIELRRAFDPVDPKALLDDVFGAPARERGSRFARGERVPR